MSVPNQLITKTKKTKPQKDFLMISNKDWIEASKNLSAIGFQMYLWLIRHDESFNNELSKQAFMNDFGVSASSYDRAWADLRKKGYAVQKEKGSNIYYIYPSPQDTTTSKLTLETTSTSKLMSANVKIDVDERQNWCQSTSEMNIEIDKQIDINNNKQLNQTECGSSPEETIKISKEEFVNQGLANYATQIKVSASGNLRYKAYGKYYEIIQ